MKLLLDTHVFIWAAVDPARLGERVRRLIRDRGNAVLLSAISAYEIEFKRHRDPFLDRVPRDLEKAATLRDFGWLAVTASHASRAGRLPRLHGDPFDRILVAQAMVERAALISANKRLPAYGVEVIW